MLRLASNLLLVCWIAFAETEGGCSFVGRPDAVSGAQLLQVSKTQPQQSAIGAGNFQEGAVGASNFEAQANTAYTIHVEDNAPAPAGVGLLHSGVPLSQIRRIETSTGNCLNFLHIPKNAGTTVELFTVTSNGTKANAGWGIQDKSLKCSIGSRSPLGCQISDEFGHTGNCSVWHIPPVYDPALAASYEGCDTFCIGRHPLSKAISQHIYVGGKCDGDDFAKTVKKMSYDLLSTPFQEDCHWVQQSAYRQHCQKVLQFENLEEDFSDLMTEYKFPLALGVLAGKTGTVHNRGGCDLSEHIEKIPDEAIQWVEQYYADDYKQFGYERTPPKKKG